MREKLKTGLIAVLILSAVLLGWQSRLFGNSSGEPAAFADMLRQLLYNSSQAGGGDDQTQTPGAAMPICVAVTNDGGLHYGARYDLGELNDVYDKSVVMMGDAFEAASAPYAVDEQAWQTALLSKGIYFEYLSPVGLSVLDGWFGAEITGDWGGGEVRRLCVAETGGNTRLYFQLYDTGRFYAADTEVSGGLGEPADSFGVNSAVFAFEVGGNSVNRDLYALLMPDRTAYAAVYADNPLIDETVKARALEGLGVTDQPSYPDKSGSVNYVDNKFILTLKQDGTVIYRVRDQGSEQETAAVDEGEAVELARNAVAGSIGSFCKDAAVYFEAVSADGKGGYEVTFRYVAAGGLVQLYQDGAAAVVTVRDGAIGEMTLRFRSYTVSGEMAMLPEMQVSAAADGPFMLCYADNGGSGNRLDQFWIAAPVYP